MPRNVKIAVFGIRPTSCATKSDLTGYMPFRAMRPKLGIIGKWRFCYSERIFRVGRVARNVENACFSHFVAMYSVEKCISPVCKTIRDIPERVVVERLR